MIKDPIKITDLASLQSEKQRLQMFCSYQEELLKEKINSLKSNYKQIIGEEFLPFTAESNTKVSNVLDWINEFVIGKLLKVDVSGKNKLSGVLIKLAEVGVIRLFNKFIKNKFDA
ncbi:MAG: hypothetical protein V4608_08850 [Bacteroidota bacterium]